MFQQVAPMTVASPLPSMASDVRTLVALLQGISTQLTTQLAAVNDTLARIARALEPAPTVGIEIVPGIPQTKKEQNVRVSLIKKQNVRSAPIKATPSTVLTSFQLVDNENDSCTVIGVDAAGNKVDISSVASISVSSDTPSVLTVDAPSGATFNMTATGPLGSANVTVVATWTDGSVGPFTVTLPVSVVSGPAAGILIVPGTPTLKP